MAKMTKAEVFAVMDEWAGVEQQIEKAELKKNKALAPLIEAHNEVCKPVLAKFEKAISPLEARADELREQVVGYLESANRDQIIATESAVAEQKTETRIGSREADAEQFWSKFKSKGSSMWSCMKVVLRDAEKLVGKDELDKICGKKEVTTVSRTLRLG